MRIYITVVQKWKTCLIANIQVLVLFTRLLWSLAQTTLAAQARKALHVMNQVNSQCEQAYSYSTAIDNVDHCIVPILIHGSEVWGPSVYEAIERLNSKFCKIQLGFGNNTPNPAVLGECGRDRMYIN